MIVCMDGNKFTHLYRCCVWIYFKFKIKSGNWRIYLYHVSDVVQMLHLSYLMLQNRSATQTYQPYDTSNYLWKIHLYIMTHVAYKMKWTVGFPFLLTVKWCRRIQLSRFFFIYDPGIQKTYQCHASKSNVKMRNHQQWLDWYGQRRTLISDQYKIT